MADGSDTSTVLAVDLGTGGPKVALVDRRGRIVAHAKSTCPVQLTPDGGAEQDPGQWWDAVVRAAADMFEQPEARPDAVAGVVCTAQWSGTVPTGSDGSPLRPALIWMDSRGSAVMRRQMTGPLHLLGYDVRKLVRWIRLTGGAPGRSGKDPTAHILWIKQNEPGVYRETHAFLEPVDWLTCRLTGRFSASYDSIVAHWVTDNRRIGAVRYDERLLAMAGLERAKLPDLVPSCTVVGALGEGPAKELGVPAGVPVVTGTGDVHSAAVGSGAVADFDGHLYIGTSSWISCHVPFKKTDVLRNVASIPSALPGRYLVADEHETAGACLTFLAQSLLGGDDGLGALPGGPGVYARLDEVAASAPAGAGGVLFTPWLNGERSPVDDHTIRAGLHNMSLSTTRRDVVRAVYEGVAFNSRWLLGAVERFVGRPFPSLAFIGGGANSAVWAQIHADVMGRPIRQVADPVLANVRGAGLLGWIALGALDPAEIPALVDVRASFEPDPAMATLYDERFHEFVALYKQTKAIHRRLNHARLG
ncbi:MAG TPA: FGGY-family carbohydrate kinase [Acidimicrobiales bacterium]|nr:FGGY-family carbohydrate kinase [Acidimicrobiales bacterium]